MYRLGAEWPGSRDGVSTRRRWSKAYEPKGLGLYVREMWVMMVAVGEAVVVSAKDDGLPPGAGKYMSAAVEGILRTVSPQGIIFESLYWGNSCAGFFQPQLVLYNRIFRGPTWTMIHLP